MDEQNLRSKKIWFITFFVAVCVVTLGVAFARQARTMIVYTNSAKADQKNEVKKKNPPPLPPLDTFAYDQKMIQLANYPVVSSTISLSTSSTASSTKPKIRPWPVKAPYPNAGALLPFNRIISYYGNLYSKQMGVLGQYPEEQMLQMLASTTAQWQAADPTTIALPALHYIAIAAQAGAGKDGMYRSRMPDDQVNKVLAMANKINGIVFLDLQVGLSTVQKEVSIYEDYLKMPNVHLGLDPEFSMKHGERPGTVIGTMDAADINYAANYLADLVRKNNLPPKILVIHRFTEDMLTNYKLIKPLPEVQIVIDMDGFGFPAKKLNTYKQVVANEPVQFTGFKLFYKNDAAGPMGHLMTPSEVLKLSPRPSYIQYQ